jgi:RimJ/RimL family protein N-acetyltransferase
MLSQASDDTFLGDIVGKTENKYRLGIYLNNNLIGFLTPRQDQNNNWRTGAIYMLPRYRGKGYGSEAIKLFFSDKQSGSALIEPTNIGSRKAYEKAGLKFNKRFIHPTDNMEYDLYKT